MKKNKKQLAALFCVILLVLLYIATLIVALLDFPGSDRLFTACLMATVGLPILLWIYIWIYGKYTGKHTIADPDISALNSGISQKYSHENKEEL